MSQVLVKIQEGELLGSTDQDANGNIFYSFLGIPYAKHPVGPLRFKPPEPAEPWLEPLDATKEGKECIQRNFLDKKQIVGSEACLNLNVFTPILEKQKRKLPVMVWIHGGAFVQGSNSPSIYGPHFLLTEEIVFVSINYRLGLLGFLQLKDQSLGVTGNAGFKDMVLALKWVQRNIAAFNGDPDNVTIFGESAGAAAVHLLVLSPMTKGLFHKAIAQSGCALNGWVYARSTASRELAEEMGKAHFNDTELLEHLLKLSPEEIFNYQTQLEDKDVLGARYRCLGLVLEPEGPEAFMTEHPEDIIRKGNYNKVPLIFGYTTDEGMLFDILVKRPKQSIYSDDIEVNVPEVLGFRKGGKESKLLAEKIVNYYFGVKKFTRDAHLRNIYKMTTDNCFVRDILFSVKGHIRTNSYPVYLYRMSIESELNMFKALSGIEMKGVCHGDDIGYLFKNFMTPQISDESIEEISLNRFVKLWTNFAKTSNPTSSLNKNLSIKWPPVYSKLVLLDIGEELSIIENPEEKLLAFWEEMYKNRSKL